MDEFQSTYLVNSRLPRHTYLVTYVQAELTKFLIRKGFGKQTKKHFNSGSGKVKVQHWTCAIEKRQDGGEHYHVTLKLTRPKRWKPVKQSISHPATRRRGDVVTTSLCTSQRRCTYVSNETHNDVSVERHQDVSVVRLHDVLLVCRDDVPWGRNDDVPSVRLHDVSNKSQMKHPTTSQWYVTKTSQWYVSTTSHQYVSTTSPVTPK